MSANPWLAKARPKTDGEQRELPPAENQPAVCVALVDLGTQEMTFKSRRANEVDQTVGRRKLYVVWELSEAPGRPLLGKDYILTLTAGSQLRGLVETLNPGGALKDEQEVDLRVLKGKPCMLDVEHGQSQAGRAFAKVKAVAKLPRSMPAPKPSREPVVWTVGDKEPPPDWLPWLFGEPVEEVIRRCEELKGAPAGRGDAAEPDDDTPF